MSPQNIREVHPGDPEWPTQLSDLGAEAPSALWVRGTGRLNEVLTRSVAITGSRAATAYGGHVASDLSHGLAARGYTVVSGAGYGIDALAHRGALAAQGLTVAVLATGIDIAYPASHDRLLEQVSLDGLLVSPFEPGSRPTPATFTRRNQILAALTGGLVVVETSVRGASLRTAAAAAALPRPVMAVPGPVTSSLSAGCHSLIRDRVAVLVTSVEDVLAALKAAHG